MALFNYATKEITLKIVYYGPGLSGKTTNLQYLHSVLNTSSKGKLLSLSTEADRTLFFDFLPVELGKIRDFSIRFQLYTVPGQVRYNATRRIVLKGADAVVFVADSQSEMREQNIESIENMKENLLANNIDPETIPIVLQYNKRDLRDVATVEDLNTDLNAANHPVIEGVAIDGTGVEEAFRLISRLLLHHISKKHKIEIEPAEEKKEEPSPPVIHVERSGKGGREASDIFPEPWAEVQETVREERTEAAPVFMEDTETDFTVHRKEEQATTWGSGENVLLSPESIDTDRVIRDIERIHETLNSVKDSLRGVTDEMKALSEMVKDSLRGVTDEMKALSEMRKTQQESNRLLREIGNAFAGLKKKKRWFRF